MKPERNSKKVFKAFSNNIEDSDYLDSAKVGISTIIENDK